MVYEVKEKLKLGEEFPVCFDTGAMTPHHYRLIYAGMPSKDTFSMVRKLNYGPYNESSQMYFPIDQEEIELSNPNITINVKKVTPREIILSYVRR